MADPVFPTLPSGALLDSSKFAKKRENPALATPLEGGYMATRPRHTRRPRVSWVCAYTEIDNADLRVLEDFWDEVRGGSVIFDWLNPQDGQTYSVRFVGDGLNVQYVGVGHTQRWNVTFELQQA